MNECFTDLIFRNFSVERKKKMRGRGTEEEGEEAEEEVRGENKERRQQYGRLEVELG